MGVERLFKSFRGLAPQWARQLSWRVIFVG